MEIHRVARQPAHDSHLMVYLPAERVLYTADTPAAGTLMPISSSARATLAATDRLKLQWDSMIPAHALNRSVRCRAPRYRSWHPATATN